MKMKALATLAVSMFAYSAEAAPKPVKVMLDDALYLSSTPPEGSWRTCNHWAWLEKDMTIAEALEKPVCERSAKGDVSERIDYIYVSPGTRVSGYRTIPATRSGKKLFPSDHFPTVATVVFKLN